MCERLNKYNTKTNAKMNYLTTIAVTIILTLTILSMKTETPKPISKLEKQMNEYDKQLDLKLVESAEKLAQKAMYFRNRAIQLERENNTLKAEIKRLKKEDYLSAFRL